MKPIQTKNRKRWAGRLLTTVLVLGMLLPMAACSEKEKEGMKSDVENDRIGQLCVFVDSSLGPVMTELKHAYESDHPGLTLALTVDSSEKLVLRIKNGERCDLLMVDSKEVLETIEELVFPDSITDVMEERIVLAASRDNPKKVKDLDDCACRLNEGDLILAVDDRNAAVLSRARKILNYYKCNATDLANERSIWFCADGQKTVDAVCFGECDCGLLRESDAVRGDVQILDRSSDEMCPPVILQAAVLTDSRYRDGCMMFLDYLWTETGRQIITKSGFSPAAIRNH